MVGKNLLTNCVQKHTIYAWQNQKNMKEKYHISTEI